MTNTEQKSLVAGEFASQKQVDGVELSLRAAAYEMDSIKAQNVELRTMLSDVLAALKAKVERKGKPATVITTQPSESIAAFVKAKNAELATSSPNLPSPFYKFVRLHGKVAVLEAHDGRQFAYTQNASGSWNRNKGLTKSWRKNGVVESGRE